jgi:peptidyl-prolyl cis-trans isomerase B (cyclophilin B)
MKKIFCGMIIMLGFMALLGCKGENTMQNAIVTIEVTGYSEPIVLELYYDKAPNTVRNFIKLVQEGYYDGLIFHRVIRDFMIQGGASSQPTCKIKGEFSDNQVTNDLKHVRGVISMARTTDPNSATSQFFIMHKTNDYLDGKYAAFGMMLSGWATLDAIAAVATNTSDRPRTDVVIKSITVDTKGTTYDQPVCLN